MERLGHFFWMPALGALVMIASVTAQAATVVAGGEAFAIETTLPDVRHLWVTPEDFTRINGFVLKPEGACLDDLCIPLRQDRDGDLFVTREGQPWLNATAFADKVQQAYVVDREAGVWSFGQAPAVRKAFLESAMAPDFALTDRDGNVVRLSDFRGKKVLIITWASW
jgi:hypothetical protein